MRWEEEGHSLWSWLRKAPLTVQDLEERSGRAKSNFAPESSQPRGGRRWARDGPWPGMLTKAGRPIANRPQVSNRLTNLPYI